MNIPSHHMNIHAHMGLPPPLSVPEGTALLMAVPVWGAPILFVALGLFAGIVAEKMVLGALRRLFAHSTFTLSEELVKLLRGILRGLLTLWGMYLATYTSFFTVVLPSISYFEPIWLEVIRRGIYVIGILLILQLVAKIAVALMRFYLEHSQGLRTFPHTSIFENLIRVAVFLAGMLFLLQGFGVSVLPFLTALGVGGLAVSLALQDTLANLFGGIQILMSHQLKVGDYIKLDNNVEGFVRDIGWRNTVIGQRTNNVVIVPNHTLSSSIVTNYSSPAPEVILSVDILIAYENDLDRVEAITLEVAKTVLANMAEQVPGFEPAVRYGGIGELGVSLSVSLKTMHLDSQGLLKHEFIKAVHVRYKAEGIQPALRQNIMTQAHST